MTFPLKRSRSDDCLSDYALDQFRAGMLDVAHVAQTNAHLAACERCQQALARIDTAKTEFQNTMPTLELHQPRWVSSRPRRAVLGHWMFWAPAALAIMLIGSVWIVSQREFTSNEDISTRVKGGSSLNYFILHEGKLRRGSDREQVFPRDVLQFFYSASSETYLAILSVDGARNVNVYYPIGETHTALIAAGVDRELPLSTELDDVLGEERIYQIVCEAAQPIETLKSLVTARPENPKIPSGCRAKTLVLVKQKRE